MEHETLGYSSPFHGRRTAQLKLLPFNFFETKRHYTGFSSFDIAVIYGVTGGVPKYLEQFSPDLSIEDNIRNNFFDTSSFLFEEPANILSREVRDPEYYNAVLRVIASGKLKNSEIATAVGLETSACTAYLKNLISLGFVGKHTPISEKVGKKTVYEIEDHMFRFWYRFIPGNMSLIQGGTPDRIWRGVSRDMPGYLSKVFEDICRQWFVQRNQDGRLPVKFVEIGRWWGVDPVWKVDSVMPIVAYADDDNAIFADCVWSEDPAQVGALNSLEERSRLFRYSNRHLYLFSRSGFSPECTETAKRFGANLVMFE
jgi:AAA+ ATPase superfamily predicted ATPase